MIKLKEKLNQMFILGTEGEEYKSLLKEGLGGNYIFLKRYSDIRTI